MQTRLSRYFIAIAQHRSIRDAADALHVAQSALSRQIAKVEDELGCALFERHTRGVALTDAGEIYLRYARDLLAQEDRMRGELQALQHPDGGTLRIHAVESLARSVLPQIFAGFRTIRPGVQFNVTIAGSQAIAGAVREVATDIGIGYFSQPSPDIEIRVLKREPLVAIMRARHPLAGMKQIGIGDAARYPIALTGKNSHSRNLIDTACWQAGVTLSPVLETNSVELLTGFVAHSDGITFLLRLSALEGLRDGSLQIVPTRSEILNMGAIEALTRANRRLAPIGEEFLAYLADNLAAGQPPSLFTAASKGRRRRLQVTAST